MSAELAHSWTLVIGLWLSIAVGLYLALTPPYKFLKPIEFGSVWIAAVFVIMGVVLLTSPKWTEVVIKFKDFETRIVQLQQQNATLESENTNLKSYASKLQEFNTGTAKVWWDAFADLENPSARVSAMAAEGYKFLIPLEPSEINQRIIEANSHLREEGHMYAGGRACVDQDDCTDLVHIIGTILDRSDIELFRQADPESDVLVNGTTHQGMAVSAATPEEATKLLVGSGVTDSIATNLDILRTFPPSGGVWEVDEVMEQITRDREKSKAP